MKKIIILHGRASKDWTLDNVEPQNTRHWLGWLKDESIKLGYEAYNPLVPKDWEVNYDDWKAEIEKLSDEIDENTILVGTSAGGAFWVRWLGENNKKIDKLILVAPARYPSEGNNVEMNSAFYDFGLNVDLHMRIGRGTYIFISDDEERHIRASKEYADVLHAKLIELEGRGYFTVKSNPDNCRIPEVLELIKS